MGDLQWLDRRGAGIDLVAKTRTCKGMCLVCLWSHWTDRAAVLDSFCGHH